MNQRSLADHVVRFAHLLREAGLAVDSGSVVDAVRAVRAVGVARRQDMELALAAVLVRRPEDYPIFHERFQRYFRSGWCPPEDGVVGACRPQPMLQADGDARGDDTLLGADDALPSETGAQMPSDPVGGSGEHPQESRQRAAYAPEPALWRRDLAELSWHDLPDLRPLAARVARRLATRPARRYHRSQRGHQPDPRGTFASMLRHGGEPLRLVFRRRRVRRTRLVVICDVSGSMSAYARVLLAFVYALQQVVGHRVESFVFSTDLRRVTSALRNPRPEAAVAQAVQAATDWAGGTRIGRSLQTFVQRYGEWVDRDTVVVILSDGLDTGEPDLLRDQMRRLKRRARKVVWLNPLAGDPRYEPLAVGMRTALPYVDVLAPAHNLASLMALERYL